MADGELGNLRRAPRLIEHKIAKQSRFRTEGMAGGQFDAVIPVDVTDTISSLSDSGSDGGGPVPEWFTESFSLTSGAASTLTLTYIPLDYSEILSLNGIRLAESADYTIADNVVTWANVTDLLLGIGADTWTLTATYPYYDQAADDYSATILLDGPLAYWRLGDAVGASTMVDSSGNGHAGTYFSGTLGQAGLASADDTCLLVAGALAAQSGSVLSAAGSWSDVTTITVECWVEPSTSGTAEWFVTKWDPGTSAWWALGRDASGHAVFQFWTQAGGFGVPYTVSSTSTLASGAIHYVAASYDGVNAYLYFDGVQVGTLAHTDTLGNAANTPAPAIGDTVGSSTAPYTGYIDEVALYAAALSPARIAAHYAAGL